MKSWVKGVVLTGLIGTVGIYGIYAMGRSSGHVKIGEVPPNFTLPDTNGQTHTLSDYRGKYVVLEWTNYECPYVRKHYDTGNMQGLQKELMAKGVVWLSICSSAEGKQGFFTPERWNQAIEKKGATPRAVLLDPPGKVGRQYGAKTTPHMYIVDPEGILVYQGAIDSLSSTNHDDVKVATNYVRDALNAALAGKTIALAQTTPYGCSVKY